MMNENQIALTTSIAKLLVAKRQLLAVAESCTGGGLAKACTDLPGSSVWFDRGFVTYSNEAKVDMLEVAQDTLERYGAVSEQVVTEMCDGALQHSRAHWSIAVSGVAGPGGGSSVNPVGTVWLAWQEQGQQAVTEKVWLSGDRMEVREQTIAYALEKLMELMQ